MLILESAEALAYYDHPFFSRYPAITRNKFGSGTLTYEGTVLSDALQGKVLMDVLQLAGLTGADQQLPAPVRVKHGTNRSGKTIHYYMNYSNDPQTFKYPYGAGEELTTQSAVVAAQALMLKPWDLVIIEEK
jgi:beta-galactosidase